ncbi:glycosyltransferase family 2 protein [Persicitalea jodogahamensis]|uniref:Glycosyl transferase n=1 Tax=Persicitalea jodogahamensis TaxID=402147 RepID=A0A8J3G802_9BACT|nr:glycosyltransferase family 2 protein [Persicitalea jodogahamensis]GHB61468.1 glycosyl transferase [Persicitalea jodogahamensis]
MKILFWVSAFTVLYAYVGYGLVLFGLVRVRRLIKGKRGAMALPEGSHPSLTLVVAAYNEADIMTAKIENTLALRYPAEKLSLLFITDGSTDGTPEVVGDYPDVELMHSPERKGKIHAIHRAMQRVEAEVVVFTDANTFLNKDALLLLARHYQDPTVGAVSGEKRVRIEEDADATAGEGMYWKYESTLKKWDSELHSVVGAAGELFSVRRSLYEDVPDDTILDDFMISMQIAQRGYRIVYEPEAYATELSSENIGEELKRKIRIAAGGIQSISRLKEAANPFRNPLLTFQYISHRVLRWTVAPFLMILALITNLLIVIATGEKPYAILLSAQLLFYCMALAGWFLENKKVKSKILFVPYYFCMMNYAVVMGIRRYFFGNQSAAWDKSKRKAANQTQEKIRRL